PTPDATKVHVVGAIIIFKYSRIHAVAVFNRLLFRNKRAFRIFTGCYANAENIFFVFYREVEVVGIVGKSGIGCPHLPASPGYILDVKCNTMIGNFPTNLIHRKYMVIAHIEMRPKIIFWYAGFNIMRWVDVNFSIEYVC